MAVAAAEAQDGGAAVSNDGQLDGAGADGLGAVPESVNEQDPSDPLREDEPEAGKDRSWLLSRIA